MNVLFVMLARGGSKGIPGKNLRTIDGHSLIEFKARGALRANSCRRIMISTDNADIRAEAERHGVTAPFVRPAELATDRSSSTDVLLHAMNWVETNWDERFDALMLLEPTTPFTRPQDYDAAVELMREHDAALVVGMRELEISSVFVGPLDEHGRITTIIDKMARIDSYRRQDQPPEYTMNGALYLVRWETLKATRQIYADRERSYGYAMDPFYSIEIDRPIDLAWAEFLLTHGHVDRSNWF